MLLTPLDFAGLSDVGWRFLRTLSGMHGNADGDGDVDGMDFLAWQRGYGVPSGGIALAGDLSGQGAADSFDLWLWETPLRATSGLGGLAAGQVPEPASLCLGVLSALALTSRSSRR